MRTLRAFVDSHFFSRKANLIYQFFESQKLIHLLQLVINQIEQESLPDLKTTAEGIYIPIKQALKNISENDSYEELEELVREFSSRVMTEYFRRSQLSADDFIDKMSRGMQAGAQNVGVDPQTIDGDMEWDRIRLNLVNLRSPSLESTLIPVSEAVGGSLGYLIWNEEADFKYLKKVLVKELNIFEKEELIDSLFVKSQRIVTCKQIHIESLVYLFRALCPAKPNPLMPDGRIVSESSPRKFWEVFTSRVFKPDGSRWSIGTLKNYCSKLKKGDQYRDKREEVATIVKRLEKGMGYDRDDTIVT